MARPPVFDSLVKARARELLKSGCTNEEVADYLRQELEARGQKGPSPRWVSDIRREKAAKPARVAAVEDADRAPLPVVSAVASWPVSAGLRDTVADELDGWIGETPEEEGELAMKRLVRRTPELRTGHGARCLSEGRTVDALLEAGLGSVLGCLYQARDLADLAETVREFPVPLPDGIAGDAVIERGRREREGAIALLLEAAELLRKRPLDDRWFHWAKRSPEERAEYFESEAAR
jgi:hypothetical protein